LQIPTNSSSVVSWSLAAELTPTQELKESSGVEGKMNGSNAEIVLFVDRESSDADKKV